MNKQMDIVTKISLIILCICTVLIASSNHMGFKLPDIARIIVCIVEMITIVVLVYSVVKSRKRNQ